MWKKNGSDAVFVGVRMSREQDNNVLRTYAGELRPSSIPGHWAKWLSGNIQQDSEETFWVKINRQASCGGVPTCQMHPNFTKRAMGRGEGHP